MIDRPSSAAPKEDGQAESRPQQRVFITPIGPEEPVRPLKNNDDDHHLDEYHRRGNAREQADRQACSGDEFTEKCQVSQQERQRQSLVADRNRKFVRRGVEDLLKTVGKQNGPGGEPNECVTVGRACLSDMVSPRCSPPSRDGLVLDRTLIASRRTRNAFYSLLNRLRPPSPREFGCAASC